MTSIADIKNDSRFPEIITYGQIFDDRDYEIKKIFPSLGLDNFSVPYRVKIQDELQPIIVSLIRQLKGYLRDRLYYIGRWPAPKLKGALIQLTSQLTIGKTKLVVKNKITGKITLNLHKDIIDPNKKVIFKKGESLFKIWNKINLMLSDAGFELLPALETTFYFKKFNSINIGASNPRIVFSSTGMDGAWDIATMSERGITSCQSWTSEHSTHLAGSVVDPHTAIIYLTNGSIYGRGSRMIRRCIVRVAVDENTLKPVILLERMYPSYNKSISNKFISLIKKKLNKPTKIVDCSVKPKTLNNGPIILVEPGILKCLDDQEKPYIDSKARYKSLDDIGIADKNKIVFNTNTIADNIICSLVNKLKHSRLDKYGPNNSSSVSSYLYYLGVGLKEELLTLAGLINREHTIDQCVLELLKLSNSPENICKYIKFASHKYNYATYFRQAPLKQFQKAIQTNLCIFLNAEIKKLQRKTRAAPVDKKSKLDALRKIFEPFEKI